MSYLYLCFSTCFFFFLRIYTLFYSIVPCGCIMVAGGLSILASEFPAAQRIVNHGKEKLRNFAEHKEEEAKMKKDEMMIKNYSNSETEMRTESIEKNLNGSNIVHRNKKRNGPKTSLRQFIKNRIIPLLDRPSRTKSNEETSCDTVKNQTKENH